MQSKRPPAGLKTFGSSLTIDFSRDLILYLLAENDVAIDSGNLSSIGWCAKGQSCPIYVWVLILEVGHLGTLILLHFSFKGHIMVLNKCSSFLPIIDDLDWDLL